MKYRDLIVQLQSLNEEQLDQDVTLNAFDEYFAAELAFADDDVLDEGHPYFVPVYTSDDES